MNVLARQTRGRIARGLWTASLPIVLATASLAQEIALKPTLIHNANVITVDGEFRTAEAIVIRGDRFVGVGRNYAMRELAGPDATVVDAKRRTILPGLYDSHVHPLGAAMSEADHAIPAYRSLADIKAYVADRVAKQPKGSWIVVRYAFPTRLAEGRLPTKMELDKVAPEHPVLHQAGPAGVVNTKGLELSGITKDSPDPPAGRIVRDPKTGEPTGLLRNAYSVLKDLPPDAYAGSRAPDAGRVKSLFRMYNSRGLTSIADRGASDAALGLYRGLRDRHELTLRINATRVLEKPPQDRRAVVKAIRELEEEDPSGEPNGPTGVGDHWVRIGPLKLYLDGGMLNGTAYMREPWGVGPAYQITESDYRGQLFVQPQVLSIIAEEVARRSWQMTAHVAGEASMDELLRAYAHAEEAVGIRARRWMITHANFTSAENLKRCAELGVGADLQPAWLWKDTRTLRDVLGARRMTWFHPYRKWLDAGVMIGGGSDHMIRLDALEATNPWDPWLGIWVAVKRQTEQGDVLNADQCLTRAEAIRLYTTNNAYLHSEELEKGSISPGKLADFIVIDRDPLNCPVDEIRETRVLATYVGGKVVYEAESR